jgi:hypothetical protein
MKCKVKTQPIEARWLNPQPDAAAARHWRQLSQLQEKHAQEIGVVLPAKVQSRYPAHDGKACADMCCLEPLGRAYLALQPNSEDKSAR